MTLKELRLKKNLTQRELAIKSGVNFRSLQDYEQGHKSLLSANGDTLLRLSTTLGCSFEDLLMPAKISGAPLHAKNQMMLSVILGQRFYCEKYGVAGHWVSDGKTLSTFFYYEGQPYFLPFNAHFTKKYLPYICDAAVLQIEEKIEDVKFGENEWRD